MTRNVPRHTARRWYGYIRDVENAAAAVRMARRLVHLDEVDRYNVTIEAENALRRAVEDYLEGHFGEAPARINQASDTSGKAMTIRAIVVDGGSDFVALRQQNRAEFDAAELILSVRDTDNGGQSAEIFVEKDRHGALTGRQFLEVFA